MLSRITSRLRRFRGADEGSVVFEGVIMFPVLFATVISTFLFFDAFRNQSINLKANYTISDAISRETEDLDSAFIVNAWRLHQFLTNSTRLTRMRVSLIHYDEDLAEGDRYSVIWSEQEGGAGRLDNAGLQAMLGEGIVPVMADGKSQILVETWVDYEPQFGVGLGTFTFENTIFTRPRDAANAICFKVDESTRLCPVGA